MAAVSGQNRSGRHGPGREPAPRARGSLRPGDGLAAIELAGAAELTDIYNWRTMIDDSADAGRLLPGPESDSPPSWTTPRYETIPGARTKLEALAQREPPSLDSPLPDVESIIVNRFNAAEVRGYNRLARLYNEEARRRRVYAAQRMEADIILMLAVIENQLMAEPHSVEARVLAEHDLGSRTFRESYGLAPRVYVQEMNGSISFVERYHSRVDLLLTSYPSGARVSIDGEHVGKTPYLMRDVAVGTTIDLALDKRKHETFTEQLTVEASSLGVTRFDAVLEPARRRRR